MLHRIDNFDVMQLFASHRCIVKMSEQEYLKGYDSICTSFGESIGYNSESHLVSKEHNDRENMN